ncbi:MAG: pyridoxal phosphate-dependent aminotransferase [Pseudonocardiaceae bacterium]
MSCPPVAARVRALAPGRLARLLIQAHAYDAIDLALGIPGAPPTPPVLIEEACSALRAGHNQYEIPDGNPELRRHIAATLTAPTDPDTELTITAGATEALTVAMLSTVDPGDEVIVFEPFYENFLSTIALANGIPRLVRTYPPEWHYDLAELTAAFGPRTRAIVLSTPNNPTGHVLSSAELLEIAELCERWNVLAISDEIYGAYVFDGHHHVSAADLPALRERSMVISSLSKSHAISGWRLGYLRANAVLSAAARQVHLTVCAGTAAPLQKAVARAAALDPNFGKPTDDLQAQRNRMTGIFTALGFRCAPPQGGCYLMADIRPFTSEDSESLTNRFLREARILVAPGQLFHSPDSAYGNQLIRIAFNRTLNLLDEVEQRLAPYQPSFH